MFRIAVRGMRPGRQLHFLSIVCDADAEESAQHFALQDLLILILPQPQYVEKYANSPGREPPFNLTLTLQHRQKLEPHVDQVVVLQEDERDGLVRQHVVKVGRQRPVAVLLHDPLRAVDHVVEVFLRI